MSIYQKIKSEYEKYIENNSENPVVANYIAEMNFLKKLEELAHKENLNSELEFISEEQEKILNSLKEKGIQLKNN